MILCTDPYPKPRRARRFIPFQDKKRYAVEFHGNPKYRNKGRNIHFSVDAYSISNALYEIVAHHNGWWLGGEIFTVDGDYFLLYDRTCEKPSYKITHLVSDMVVDELMPDLCQVIPHPFVKGAQFPPSPVLDTEPPKQDDYDGAWSRDAGRYVSWPSEVGYAVCSYNKHVQGMVPPRR